MPRTVHYDFEHRYRPVRTLSGVWVWEPYVDAVFVLQGGAKPRRGIALVDSGAAWCAIPRSIAEGWFDIDVAACPVEQMMGVSGLTTVPYTNFHVKAFGLWADAKVLLIDSSLYLIGRVPFFSLTDIGFFEDQIDRTRNRVLYTH